MTGRLLVGVVNGFLAAFAIKLNRVLDLGHDSWLARRAGYAILRMYSLGGGIDDGAEYLYETWGLQGSDCLKTLLQDNRISPRYKFYAELLVGQGE